MTYISTERIFDNVHSNCAYIYICIMNCSGARCGDAAGVRAASRNGRRAYIYICMSVRIFTYIYIYVYIYMYMIYVSVRIFTYIYIYVFVYLHIYDAVEHDAGMRRAFEQLAGMIEESIYKLYICIDKQTVCFLHINFIFTYTYKLYIYRYIMHRIFTYT